jgi:hypothetical protein
MVGGDDEDDGGLQRKPKTCNEIATVDGFCQRNHHFLLLMAFCADAP